MDLSNFACRAIKQTETVWELFHNLLRHLCLSPSLSSGPLFLLVLPTWQRFLWNFPKAEQILARENAGCSAIYIRTRLGYLSSSCWCVCVCVCVSLYNLQLSFILQLFFAPKTFVYMANTRASTRVCHTYTQGEGNHPGSQPGSNCFSWLSRPPTPKSPLYPIPSLMQFVESFVASKFLLCFAVVFWPSTLEFTKFVTFVIFATRARVEFELKSFVVGIGNG